MMRIDDGAAQERRADMSGRRFRELVSRIVHSRPVLWVWYRLGVSAAKKQTLKRIVLQTLASANATRNSREPPDVLFVSALAGASHLYRVEHQMHALTSIGISCDWRLLYSLKRHRRTMTSAKVLVLARVPWDEDLALVVEECRRAGVLIVFDIDDYLFDLNIVTGAHVDSLRLMKEDTRAHLLDTVRGFRETALNADEYITSTDFLADALRKFGKPCHVIRNGFSQPTLDASTDALAEHRNRPADGLLRLGYASGSMTHQRDFSVAVPAIERVLGENPNVTLTVLGRLDLNEFPSLSRFANRIEKRNIVPYHKLPRELVRFDVNLAPLEVGNPFCEAKSELKYYEAALVEVPTVASATSTFQVAIEHGVTGFLARTHADWYDALHRLVHEPELRTRIGAAARRHAVAAYGPEAKKQQVQPVFRALIERQAGARQ